MHQGLPSRGMCTDWPAVRGRHVSVCWFIMIEDILQQFDFDEDKRQRYLAMLELKADDRPCGRLLQQLAIKPNVEQIVEGFYDYLHQHRPYAEFLDGEALVARLKQSQTRYLLGFGVDFDSPEYFASRLQIGLAHRRVGLPLELYQCAYRTLQQLIIDAIPQRLPEGECRNLTRFVLQIATLDMTLAVETYYESQIHDLEAAIVDLRSQGRTLRNKAVTDSLTGLVNRDYALSMLRRALDKSREFSGGLGVIMADLDSFKAVNDNYGHQVGDCVLKDCAGRIRSAVRDFDIVGRYGGEEFVIVLMNTDGPVAQRVAERIRQHVAASPINVHDAAIAITISQGLAMAQPDESAESLIGRADHALYDAKRRGRDCVVVAE